MVWSGRRDCEGESVLLAYLQVRLDFRLSHCMYQEKLLIADNMQARMSYTSSLVPAIVALVLSISCSSTFLITPSPQIKGEPLVSLGWQNALRR